MHPSLAIISILAVALIVFLAVIVLMIASTWKIFRKAGKPGWACIVPFYGKAVMLEIVGEPLWWLALIIFVPVVNIVLLVIVLRRLAMCFGKGWGFMIGMLLLPFIFFPILGFGKSTYEKRFGDPMPASPAILWSLATAAAFLLLEGFWFQSFFSATSMHHEPLKIISADNQYATDGTYVYYEDAPIANADPATFTVDGSYAKDDDAVYYGGDVVEGAAPTSFHTIDSDSSDFAEDDTAVYDQGVAIDGADPATFESLGYGYSKDENAVYYQSDSASTSDTVIDGADPATFTVIDDSSDASLTYDAKDATHRYYAGKEVE